MQQSLGPSGVIVYYSGVGSLSNRSRSASSAYRQHSASRMAQHVDATSKKMPVKAAQTLCTQHNTSLSQQHQHVETISSRSGNSSLVWKMARLNQLMRETKTMLDRMEVSGRSGNLRATIPHTWPSIIHSEYAKGRAERGILSVQRRAEKQKRVSKMRLSCNMQYQTSGVRRA